jgi:Zn-dependent protease
MRPSIVLHAFGGLTQWPVEKELAPRKRVSITLAGPLAGFALAGVAWVLFHYTALGDSDRGVRLALGVTIWVNLIWGVFNLVPIRGLDGGQTINGLLDWLIPKWSRVIAEVIFVATGAAAVIYGLVAGFPLLAFFAVFLTIGPYLDGSRARTPRRPPATPAEEPDEQSPEPRGHDGPTLGI